MFYINEELAYRRIGQKIYIIREINNEEMLYEFEGDAFNILNCIIYNDCDSLEKIKVCLSEQYIFEESSDNTIYEFINELKNENIILDK